MKKFVCVTRLSTQVFLFILLCVLCFITPASLCAVENSGLDEESTEWIIAASAFESNMAQDRMAELIPHYVLENIAIPSVRAVTPAEQYRRAKKSVSLELQGLYQNLQAKIFERDSLVLINPLAKELTDALEPVDDEVKKLLRKIEEKKEEANSLVESDFLPIDEKIRLWNNDASKLYTLPEKVVGQGPNDISALITGSILHTDSFIYVKASLTLYPGIVIVEEVSETDSILAIEELSARLATKLYVSIVNAQMVNLAFTINPPEAASNAVIHINGNILSPNADTVSEFFETGEETVEGDRPFATTLVPSGIHELYIESPGYNTISTIYDFSDGSEFNVQVNLEASSGTFVKITLPAVLGSVYINAMEAQQGAPSDGSELEAKVIETEVIETEVIETEVIETEVIETEVIEAKVIETKVIETKVIETEGRVFINNLPALGEFVSEDGVTTWFFLDDTQGFEANHELDPIEFSFVPDTANLSERIERNRKRMYNSYAALIVSLPFSFIAFGQHTNEQNSWATGNNNGENIQAWNIARYATMGVSIGLGINFLVQLGLYLYSVNAVLPEELEPLEK